MLCVAFGFYKVAWRFPNHFNWNLNVFLTFIFPKKSNLTLEQNDETDCQLIKWIYFSDWCLAIFFFSAQYFQCYFQLLIKNFPFSNTVLIPQNQNMVARQGKPVKIIFWTWKILGSSWKNISDNNPWDFFDVQCKFQPTVVKYEQLLRLRIQIQRFTKNADILEASDISFYRTFSFGKSMRWTGKSLAFWLNWHWMLQLLQCGDIPAAPPPPTLYWSSPAFSFKKLLETPSDKFQKLSFTKVC